MLSAWITLWRLMLQLQAGCLMRQSSGVTGGVADHIS
jgi:hypothetical protein